MWLFAAHLAATALAEPQPIERATLVLVRSLSYDRSVARGVGELRIGVVYDPLAASIVDPVLAVLAGLHGINVSGRTIGSPVPMPASEPVDWSAALRGYDAAVLCPGIDRALPKVVEAARAHDVVLLSLEPAYVGKGASLGVLASGSQLRLQVDTSEASQQGAEFAGELLELAQPVRSP